MTAESLGFASVWANDHVMVPPSLDPPYGRIMECIVALTLAGAVTRRVQLGTSLLILPQRPPIVTAKQLATLDVLSGGRLICGVGAGYVEEQFQFLGAEFANRGAILDEYIGVLRSLWRSGGGTYSGRWVRYAGAIFGPVPARGAAVPLWIGGNGTTAIVRAARIGDAWHPAGLSPRQLATGAIALREAASGRSVSITLKVRAGIGPAAGGLQAQKSPPSAGHPFELTGSVDQVTRAIDEYATGGCEHLVLYLFHRTPDDLHRAMEVFAERVMPQFPAE
jgi:probable F420-dependent oxidoreductase